MQWLLLFSSLYYYELFLLQSLDGSSGDEGAVDKENQTPNVKAGSSSAQGEGTSQDEEEDIEYEASTYKLGDVIDARDSHMGAWFEASIAKITEVPETVASTDTTELTAEYKTDQNANEKDDDKNEEITMETDNNNSKNDSQSVIDAWKNDGFVYHVIFEGYEEDPPAQLRSSSVRPRARDVIKLKDLKVGDKVMVNHCHEDPETRGYWYDGEVTGIRNTRTIKDMHATIYIGKDLIPVTDCKILFLDELFEIYAPGTQLNSHRDPDAATPAKRKYKPDCDVCLDNPRKKCKSCACCVCGDKKDPEKQILCDECEDAYHLYCLKPALESVPEEDEW